MHKKLVFLCAALLVLFGAVRAQERNLPPIEFEQGLGRQGTQLLDVRTLEEYNAGYIRGALLADWTKREEFARRIQSLDKARPVYVYCLSGGRSSAAAEQLRSLGFAAVYNLQGGIASWKRASRPVEAAEKAPRMTMDQYLSLIPGEGTALVDIGAVWCPPCRKMEPVIKEVVESSKVKLVNIDGGTQEELAKALKADAFPTFIIYKNGKETWRAQGIVSKEKLEKQLK